MKKLLIASIALALSQIAYAGADVDFSKAYVISEKSGVDKVTLGGIKPLWSDLFFSVDFALNPQYSLELKGAFNQSSLQEQLEQSLRNTKWQGTYKVYGRNYTTTLNLTVVQDGYVGGEISHQSTNISDGSLTSRVAGDIINQFQINGNFFDQDRIASDVFAKLPASTPTKQLIRVKRMRTLDFTNGSNLWSNNREYRMTLENGVLSGIVAVPSETVGATENSNDYGDVLLQLVR